MRPREIPCNLQNGGGPRRVVVRPVENRVPFPVVGADVIVVRTNEDNFLLQIRITPFNPPHHIACANDLGIAAETIASKKELSAVISGGNRQSRVFSGWRKELVGDALAALL